MKQLVFFVLVVVLGFLGLSMVLYPSIEEKKDIVLSEPQLTGVGGVLHKATDIKVSNGTTEESKDVPETTVDLTNAKYTQDVMLVNIPNLDVSVCYLAVAGECAFGYSGTNHEIMIKREVFHRGDVPQDTPKDTPESPH